MAEIYIYAELLLNIRQVTTLASLPSDCNTGTFVTLSQNRISLSIKHEGRSARIKLPARIHIGCVLQIAPGSTRALSFRLPIADDAAIELGGTLQPTSAWPAHSITPGSELACRSCFAPLIKESVKHWKDMPCEDWAEMMDFWHCHKPDTEDDDGASSGQQQQQQQQQIGLRKGYGAGNCIAPTPGVGLVDTTYFLLMRRECNVVLDADPIVLKVNDNSLITINAPPLCPSHYAVVIAQSGLYWRQEGDLLSSTSRHNDLVRRYSCQISRSYEGLLVMCTLLRFSNVAWVIMSRAHRYHALQFHHGFFA
ncbi:MAG: hypothetical protein Q9182_007042 [Xanthomendoza sp. 2 TL-2023]